MKLRPHPIENKPEYKISWDVYSRLAPNTPRIRRQAIARMSVSSLLFQQSKEFNTAKAEVIKAYQRLKEQANPLEADMLTPKPI